MQNNTLITVSVDPPQLKSQMGGASKHHQYHIHGTDELGQFDVWRRYSDFIILKQHMSHRWPGIYISSLPEKKFIGNNQVAFLDTRKQGLQNFVKLISEQNYLWYGDEFQLFIKSKSHEVDKFLGNLGKTNNRQIAAKYRNKFPQILSSGNQQNAQENNNKVTQFRVYLKNTSIILQKLSKVADLMTQARRKFNERYDTILNTTLPNYEQKCIAQYTDDKPSLWFMNNKINGLGEVTVNLIKTSQKNPFSIINQLIKQQLRQLSNFQQILKIKQQFQSNKFKALSKTKDLQIQQSKIKAGKQSILNKIKSASKQQQLQQNKTQLLKAKQQLNDAQEICKVIDKMLVSDQITRFKQARKKNYYAIVKEMAKAEKDNCEMEIQYWGKIVGGQGDFKVKQQVKSYNITIDQEKSQKKQNDEKFIKKQQPKQQQKQEKNDPEPETEIQQKIQIIEDDIHD